MEASIGQENEGEQPIAPDHRLRVQLAPLDFEKLKNFLKTNNDQIKLCATLQALRWRISRVGQAMRR